MEPELIKKLDLTDCILTADALNTQNHYKIKCKNLGILKRICLAVLKFVYKMSLNKIRFLLSLNFESEIEKIFKLFNTKEIALLLKKRMIQNFIRLS